MKIQACPCFFLFFLCNTLLFIYRNYLSFTSFCPPPSIHPQPVFENFHAKHNTIIIIRRNIQKTCIIFEWWRKNKKKESEKMSSRRVIVMILHICTHWWSFIIIIFFATDEHRLSFRHRTLSVGILDGNKDITMCVLNGINNSWPAL